MTVAELRAGVALLPVGKRRNSLHEYLETRVLPSFVGRVLPFDLACTRAYAELLARVCKAAAASKGRMPALPPSLSPTVSPLPRATQALFRPPV